MRIPRRKGAWASASWRLQIAALVVLAALLLVSLLQDSADLQAVARRLQEKLSTDPQPLQAREIIIKNTVSVNAYIHTNHQQQQQPQQAAGDTNEAPPSTHALVENVAVDVTDLEEQQRVKDDEHEEEQQPNKEEEEDVDVVNHKHNLPAAAGQSQSESAESLVLNNNNDAVGDQRSDAGEDEQQQRQVMEMPGLSLTAERMDHREEQEEEGGDCKEEEESSSAAEGEWVYDEVERPLYREEDCGFLTEQVTCIRNGRRNDTYQKWRWQPRQTSRCNSSHLHLLSRFQKKRRQFKFSCWKGLPVEDVPRDLFFDEDPRL